MICIPNCDKIVPGMFMGAMRVNIPTVFVSGGPMEAGKTASGKTVDLIDAFVGGVQRQNGKITAEELDEIEKAACPTCGSCSGMFTANSMNCLAEALGMGLPGNGTVLATWPIASRSMRGPRRGSWRWPRSFPDSGRGMGSCRARSPRQRRLITP